MVYGLFFLGLVILGYFLLFTPKKKNKIEISSIKPEIEYEFGYSEDLEELKERLKQPKLNTFTRIDLSEISGFIGLVERSPDYNYVLSFNDGYDHPGNFALLEQCKLLFKKELNRPNNCLVNNDGVSICCDWLNSELSGKFYVFNKNGVELFSLETTANLGYGALSSDSKIALFYTYNSQTDDGNKLFVIDINSGKVLKNELPLHFITAKICTDKKEISLVDRDGCVMHIDFNGNEVNDNYQIDLFNKSKINNLLLYFYNKPIDIKYNNKNYLKALEFALNDKNETYYSFGGYDKLYREIGEYYYVNDDIDKTIFYWEKAININPKVGIKRRLNKLKS